MPTFPLELASAASTQADIRSSIVATLLRRAEELGIVSAPWFNGLRVQPQDFATSSQPPYITYREACRLIQCALEALPGSGHGLALGSRQSLAEFGLLGLAMLTAPTFGEALRTGIRFAPITGAMLDLAVVDDHAGIAVTMRMRTHEPALEAFLCEELISSCLNLCRAMLGEEFHCERVELAYSPPPYAAQYATALSTEVLFNRPDTRVVIAHPWLHLPMPAANPESARQIALLCHAQMPSEQPPAGIVAAVERRLALQVAGVPRLTDLAAELHLTERTLRRQLSAAGTSFRALLDGVRECIASELLAESNLPIDQVAVAVGFGDVRDFRRAFKRWTGRLPGEMRRQCTGCVLIRREPRLSPTP